MFAHILRRRFVVASTAWLSVVLALSYFSLGRAVKTSLNPSSLNNPPKAPLDKDGSASRKLNASSSVHSHSDGLPDASELKTFLDRENFRRWFTSIAERQFYQASEQWQADQRACAGLARFAWREALRRHDRQWFARMGPGYEQVAADVSAYSLKDGPLGEKLLLKWFGSLTDR